MGRHHWLMMQNWAKAGGFAGFIIVPIVCTFIWAISYPPLPGFRVDSEYYDCHSNKEQKGSSPETDGARQMPSLMQPNTPKRTDAKACRDERERLQKATNERGLTVATWILAFATCFLVAATSVLWVFTGLLWRTTSNSVKIAERALTDLERPWLFVTVAQRLNGYPTPHDRWPAVVFSILNGGRFPAEIIECYANFVQTDG